jgi:hypothetical protein
MPCAIDAAHSRLLGVGRHTDDTDESNPPDRQVAIGTSLRMRRLQRRKTRAAQVAGKPNAAAFFAGVGLNLMILSFVG